MPLRILHTSDWHLGHALHDLPRDHEHDCFLAWLTDTLEAERIDALLIAGDVFENANPPASAQARWYAFLAGIRARLPDLDVVVIGGNHDSAARLDAPVPLLHSMRIHVVGGLPRRTAKRTRDRTIELDRVIIPIHDAQGKVAALVTAIPYLRPADLALPAQDPAANPPVDPLIEGVRRIYTDVLDAARARLSPGQALIAMGHCYMASAALSELSERRILGGNQHALPADIFPPDVAYVALGHLHKAQRVSGRDHIRYAGSPIPLALNEAPYRHQVCIAELDGASLAELRIVPVPRAVPMIRIPKRGAIPPAELLAELQALDDWDGKTAPETRPYLEACVSLSKPEANLRRTVEDALTGKRPRLLRLGIEYTGDGAALAESLPGLSLRDLAPADVFLRRYHRDHHEEPPADLIAAFHDLVDEVARQDEDQGVP